MKPAKKTKKVPLISKARARETRRRLTLYDRAERAERALYDAEAVVVAAQRFLRQSKKAVAASAGVAAMERAEAVFDAAKQFLEQSSDAVSTAQQTLDAARDSLFSYNDKRVAAQSGEDIGLHKKVLTRRGERPHAVEIDDDSMPDEASATDVTFLNRWADALAVDLTFLTQWAEAYNAQAKKKK